MKEQRKVVWPPLDEVSTPLVKKAKRIKKFAIESYSSWFGTWSIIRRYETEKQRDQAFDKLTKNGQNGFRGLPNMNYPVMQYRKVDL